MSALLAALVLGASCPSPLEPEERAQAACDLLAQPAATNAPPPDRARLLALLDQPEFSRARNRNSNTLLILMKRFWDWLQSVLETREANEFAKLTPFIVLGVAFAAVLFGVLQFRRRRAPGRLRRADGALAAPLELDAPGAHLGRARALLATAPRQAIREALLGLLSSLEQRRYARPDRVKTNRELCAELPARGAPPALTNEVLARVDWYDRAFYSLADVDPTQARAFVDAVASLAVDAP